MSMARGLDASSAEAFGTQLTAALGPFEQAESLSTIRRSSC